jgi:hypothetical protein
VIPDSSARYNRQSDIIRERFMTQPRFALRQFCSLMALCLVAAVCAVPSLAQETPTAAPAGTPIEVSGMVSQVSANSIIVAGLTVDVSHTGLDASVVAGSTVTVTGTLMPGNIIVAQVVVIINVTPTPPVEATPEATPETTPEATPEVTATPSPDGNVIIVIEGPVINIVTNIITIYDFDIEVEPNHPILSLIHIGDFVRVEGAFGSTNVVVATVISNISAVVPGATVGLEGPVESINGNIIVVNGIAVQLAPDDPRLATLTVGSFVSVQGNFQGSGTNIVLVVVNVTVINNVVIDNNPDCWYHDDAMGMGHWHCDGMGMGMGDAPGGGMGMGMGMGG